MSAEWGRYAFVARFTDRELRAELANDPPRERSSEYLRALSDELMRRMEKPGAAVEGTQERPDKWCERVPCIYPDCACAVERTQE